jgi:hypothetical protein
MNPQQLFVTFIKPSNPYYTRPRRLLFTVVAAKVRIFTILQQNPLFSLVFITKIHSNITFRLAAFLLINRQFDIKHLCSQFFVKIAAIFVLLLYKESRYGFFTTPQ